MNFDRYSIKKNKKIHNNDDTILKYVNNFRGGYIYLLFAINTNNDKYIYASSATSDLNLIYPECYKKSNWCVYKNYQDEDKEPLPYFGHNLNINNCINYGSTKKKKLKKNDIFEIESTLKDIHNIAIKMIKNYLLDKKILTINKLCNFLL